MEATKVYSWDLIESDLNPLQGTLSKEHGFMPNPWVITKAQVILPPAWHELWKNLPHHYIRKTLRDYCDEHLAPIDVERLYNSCDVWSFMKTKSVVFNIAQAWIDCERVIGSTDVMPEPETMPAAIAETMAGFVRCCECLDYCTLADICLTSAEVVADNFDPLHAHFDEMQLACPVNGSPTEEEEQAGDVESGRVRGVVENRFHLMPTIMEYRTSDLPALVAEVQRMIHTYEKVNHPGCRQGILEELVNLLSKIKNSLVRLRKSMTFLKSSTVDPVVWHRDVVKFTAGYGGHKGSSGPQTPVIHLIDAFLGRTEYGSELGEIILQVRKQLQPNHQRFVQSVVDGPCMRTFAETLSQESPTHPVVTAFNDAVQEFVKGFLAVHRSKAVAYANAGFGKTNTPRIFTAGTQYHWPNTRSVTTKLDRMFSEATAERAELGVAAPLPKKSRSLEDDSLDPALDGLRCPMGFR